MSKCLTIRKKLNTDILNDWIKFGTVLLVAHFLNTLHTGGKFFDKNAIQTFIFVLLGFATYHIITKQIIPQNNPNYTIKKIIHNILKFGTVLIVLQLLSGNSITDEKWIQFVIYTLLGFAVYDVFTRKLVPHIRNKDYNKTINTIVKFGTMFLTVRILTGQNLNDSKWIRNTISFLVGFMAHRLVSKKLFNLSYHNNNEYNDNDDEEEEEDDDNDDDDEEEEEDDDDDDDDEEEEEDDDDDDDDEEEEDDDDEEEEDGDEEDDEEGDVNEDVKKCNFIIQ